MTNHAHLLITPPTKPALPQFVKYLCQKYAQRRNYHRKGSGKLFEERYLSWPVEDALYLAHVTAYIDLNPRMAGMHIGYFEEYPYTTLHLHTGNARLSKIPADILTLSRYYLGLGKTPEARAAIYLGRVESHAEKAKLLEGISRLEKEELVAQQEQTAKRRFVRPNGTHAV